MKSKHIYTWLIFIFVLVIPLKENWSSIALVVYSIFSIYIFFKSKIKDRIGRSDINGIIHISIAFALVSGISHIINMPYIDDIDFNRFSFPFLVLGFLLTFYFRIFVTVERTKIFLALFIGISISATMRIAFSIYNCIKTGENFLFTRVEIPYEAFFSSNPLIYSVFLNFCVSYVLIEIFKNKKSKLILIMLLVCLCFAGLTYFSTTGLVSLFINVVLTVLYFKFKSYYKKSTALLFSSTFLGFLVLLTPLGAKMLTYVDGESSRVRNYNTSVSVFKDKGMFNFGFGVGNELNTLQLKRKKKSWEFLEKYHAHNQYFEFILGGGFLYGLLFLLMLIWSINYALVNDKLLLVLFLNTCYTIMFFESLLVIHKGFLFVSYFWVYLIFERNE